MPIHTGCPIEFEDIEMGGGTLRIWYYYDPEYDEWLSIHTDTLTFGRNATSYSGFLRAVGNVVCSATHGLCFPYDGKIIWVTAHSTANPQDMLLKVYAGGSSVASLDWEDQVLHETTDIDIDGYDVISAEVAVDTGAPIKPDRPTAMLGIKWRRP